MKSRRSAAGPAGITAECEVESFGLMARHTSSFKGFIVSERTQYRIRREHFTGLQPLISVAFKEGMHVFGVLAF